MSTPLGRMTWEAADVGETMAAQEGASMDYIVIRSLEQRANVENGVTDGVIQMVGSSNGFCHALRG